MSAEKFEKAFWMVWHEGGQPPRVQHGTKKAAENEAKRLARINPGDRFVVLESCCAFQVNDLTCITYEHPLPF